MKFNKPTGGLKELLWCSPHLAFTILSIIFDCLSYFFLMLLLIVYLGQNICWLFLCLSLLLLYFRKVNCNIACNNSGVHTHCNIEVVHDVARDVCDVACISNTASDVLTLS